MQSNRVNCLPLTLNLFLLPPACAVVAAPAVLVAVSRMVIFGGGGAGLRGVFWLRGARGRLSGEAAACKALRSMLWGREGAFSSLSRCNNGACLFLLKVGGASFSWSCVDGRSGRGAGTLNTGCSDSRGGREWESVVAFCELGRVGGGGEFDPMTELLTSLELIGLPEAKSRYVDEYNDARFPLSA